MSADILGMAGILLRQNESVRKNKEGLIISFLGGNFGDFSGDMNLRKLRGLRNDLIKINIEGNFK